MSAFRQSETTRPRPAGEAASDSLRGAAAPGPVPAAGAPARACARPRRRIVRMSGYVPRSPALYRAWNLALVVPLILLSLPLLAFIAAALGVTQGPRNIFHCGERIGRKGRPFRIIKFKTLRDEAAQLTRDRVLPPDARVETPLGKHLRETRLDELPQLFNVLKGDMNLLGPRPVRPAIAAACRRYIRNYDARFKVKPGLVGYTQALMPHGADKAIRARINAMLCRRHVRLGQEVLFLAITAWAVVCWSGRVVARLLGQWRAKTEPRPFSGAAQVAAPDGRDLRMELLDIDRTTLRLQGTQALTAGGPYRVSLGRMLPGRRWKSARCTAVLLESRRLSPADGDGRPMYRHTLRYRPASPLHDYLLQRYMLGGVLVR